MKMSRADVQTFLELTINFTYGLMDHSNRLF
jgi:hypothetical protein